MRPHLLDYVAAFVARRAEYLRRLRSLPIAQMTVGELREALDDTGRFGRLRQVALELHQRLERAQRRVDELEAELCASAAVVTSQGCGNGGSDDQ